MTTEPASRAVQLIPPMLGADGPRDYLLLVQNNAEVRATGGIPGSVILLRAEAGAVTIVDTRSGGSLGSLPAPVVPLTDAESNLFGPDLAADMRDVTFTPDFPRSAEIARSIWAQQVGGEVDGVVSVDPGALALVLAHTGPVPVAPGPMADALGGTLTGANAADDWYAKGRSRPAVRHSAPPAAATAKYIAAANVDCAGGTAAKTTNNAPGAND